MDPFIIILFVVLFCLSAFFSWTELALMSIPSHKLNALAKEWKIWSKSLFHIKQNNDRLLIAILIWNNLVNVYTAALATTIAISFWEKSWLPQAQAVWIATWIITFLLLLFWEIIPKSFATKNAVFIALLVAPIYKILLIVLYPAIIFIEFIIKLFTRKEWIEKVTDEEIESFIDMWKDTWTLEKEEHERIKNMLDFNDITAEEIMTPRVNIDAIDINSTLKEAKTFYQEHTHSRIPIYDWTIDKISHFITIRDILLWDKKEHIRDLDLPNVLKIPLNQPIDKILNTFKKSRKHLAIVIDEYGWVAGLLTLEDIMEEIFWEIRDETDNETEEIKSTWKNQYLIESWVLVDNILDKFSLDFKDIWLKEHELSWENVSFLITHKLERFPINWEEIIFKSEENETKQLVFKILEVEDWWIGKIEVKLVS